MNQILHIFKKDARRHWPEILISLALLALFTHHELHPWRNSNPFSSLSPYFFILAGSYILPHISQPLDPPPNATRPLLCTVCAGVVVGKPHKKLWPALINCRLYSPSIGRNRLVGNQNSFWRHG